jgi:ABC-type sugar transport system ATPase subunit
MNVGYERVHKVHGGGVHAIHDLTLAVADGEFMVLVGPSGCGKSTALRVLAGLDDVTSGTLRIGERVVNHLSPQARNVAMVFQDYALYPHMTVRENLEFPMRMRKLGGDEMRRRVQWAAELLGLGPLLGRRPAALSGGQRQRVAMGRALVRDPAVFLLDEPLSNIDAKLRVQVRAELQDLQRRTGATMIYVTHDQSEAMTLGHRVAVLNQGRLQQVAAPRALYERPANVFVAGFIGSPPMNLLPGRFAAAGAGTGVDVAGQRITIDQPPGCVAGGAVTVGLRPEALRLAALASTAPVIRARVEQVEYLGHETLVHLDAGGEGDGVRFIARLAAAAPVGLGELADLAIDPASIHLFAADGEAIPRSPAARGGSGSSSGSSSGLPPGGGPG